MLTRSGELRESQQECSKLLKEIDYLVAKSDNLEKSFNLLQNTVDAKKEQIDFLTSLFKEEKEEKRVLYERIQEFAGLKEKEQIEVSGNKTIEFKATESRRGRGAVKAALEERAQALLKKQKENEQAAIENGALAP